MRTLDWTLRRLLAVVITIGSIWGDVVSAQAPAPVRDTILENGLQVIVMPNHAAPVVTLEVVLRAGAFTQLEPEDEGLPHVLEHMLFRAYGGRGWGAYAADAAAVYNGTTSSERVTYFITLPADNAERGMELLGNLFREPSFDGRELDRELQVVRGELERRASDPYFLLASSHDRVLWGAAFQRKNTIGNVASILGARATRIDEHYRRYYVPNNAALIVSGDVDTDDAFEWADDRLGRWRRGSDPFEDFPPLPIEPLTEDRILVVDAHGSDVTFMVGWHGPSVREDPGGTHAADVFAEMLSQPTSATQRRLVDTGVFQSVDMSYSTLQHVGQITLVARTTPDYLAQAIVGLGTELARLSEPGYFDERDVEAAKKRLRVRRALARESTPNAAHTVASYWSVAGLDYYATYGDDIQDVTVDDLHAYLARYVRDRPRAISALGTEATYEALLEALPAAAEAWGPGR